MNSLEPLHRPGLFLVSRNSDEIGNRSPGFWNHAAACGPNGWVVEAQREPGMVIGVPFEHFLARYPEVVAFWVLDAEQSSQLAEILPRYVGGPYHLLRANCVDVLRVAVNDLAGERVVGWERPDHVYQSGFEVLWHKLDYEHYQPPADWTAGFTSDPVDLLFPPAFHTVNEDKGVSL